MILIRCAGCRTKLFKYEKIGPGQILICHKSRIIKIHCLETVNGKIQCKCGAYVGIDKGDYYKMIAKGFIASGTKSNS
jgi:hypothetical protein